MSLALCDATLVDLHHPVYSYPSVIENLMLHEQDQQPPGLGNATGIAVDT